MSVTLIKFYNSFELSKYTIITLSVNNGGLYASFPIFVLFNSFSFNFFLFIYFLVMPCSVWDLNFPIRDPNYGPCIPSAGS